MGERETMQDKIARLTRERDEMATQAGACAEEVDRVRVEIGTVQAQVERLKTDLYLAEMERDDAHQGAAIWALRCGVIIGRSPIPDAPAEAGMLAAETMRQAAGGWWRWPSLTRELQQRWALVEAACVLRARSETPEATKLIREAGIMAAERDQARRAADRLRTALAESERKRAEAEADLAEAQSHREILTRANAELTAGWVEDATHDEG